MPEAIIKIHPLIIAANRHLRAQAFSSSTANKYNSLWRKLAKFMAASNLDSYDKGVGQDFLAHLHGQFSYSMLNRSQKSVVRKIQYLTEFQEKGSVQVKHKGPGHSFTGNISSLMETFISSRQQAGFSQSTLSSNKLYLHVLFVFLQESGVRLVSSITPADVVAFVESQKDTSVTTQYGMFGVIKNFLKYLHTFYPHTHDLSAIIPKVNYIRQAKLPSVYSREEIQSLLAVIDRGNPKGKRDYALMLIGARLGLRASDILGLTFANLRWDKCQIVLDQKKPDGSWSYH
jgi:integrase/recombinase XerD